MAQILSRVVQLIFCMMLQVQAYMGALLQALAHVHKHHIVHRDVKPANFLHSRRSKRFLLVDFGLAQVSMFVHLCGFAVGLHLVCRIHFVTIPLARFATPWVHGMQETTETGITDRPPRKTPQTKLDRQAPAHVLHTYGKPFRYGCGAKDGGAGKSDRRREQDTQRAGTRGFRAPEVCLRVPIVLDGSKLACSSGLLNNGVRRVVCRSCYEVRYKPLRSMCGQLE